LTPPNAAGAGRLAHIEQLAQAELGDLAQAVNARQLTGGGASLAPVLDARRWRMETIRGEAASFGDDQRQGLSTYVADFVAHQRRVQTRAFVSALLGLCALGAAVALLVSNRRRAEDALARTAMQLSASELGARRSAAFLEGIGVATPDMIYAKDRDRRFVYANPATLKAFGRPWDQVIGWRMQELAVKPEEFQSYDAADERVIETGRAEEVEQSVTDVDGATRVLRSMKFPLRGGLGDIIGVAGLTVDVTDAVAIRQALAQSEAKYRTIANAMPALVWTASADGLRDFYNDRWYQFTGAAPGATDGWAWTRIVHPEDRARVEEHVLRNFTDGTPYEIEYRLLGRDGPRWVLERALPLHDEIGLPQRWQGTCTDVQELYESRHEREVAIADLKAREAHLQSILGSVPDAMIVIDDHGIIQSFSAAAEVQFGWRANEAIGREVSILAPQAHGEEPRDYLACEMMMGEPSAASMGRVVVGARRDGTTFPMELSVGVMELGEQRFFTGFVRDLTERQQNERRFQAVQAELAHVSRLSAMGEMASALAHELNQPLTATASYLQGSLQLIEELPLREALLKSALSAANQQVLRAGSIIRRLREFVGKGETGRDTESLSQTARGGRRARHGRREGQGREARLRCAGQR